MPYEVVIKQVEEYVFVVDAEGLDEAKEEALLAFADKWRRGELAPYARSVPLVEKVEPL